MVAALWKARWPLRGGRGAGGTVLLCPRHGAQAQGPVWGVRSLGLPWATFPRAQGRPSAPCQLRARGQAWPCPQPEPRHAGAVLAAYLGTGRAVSTAVCRGSGPAPREGQHRAVCTARPCPLPSLPVSPGLTTQAGTQAQAVCSVPSAPGCAELTGSGSSAH